MAQTGTTGQHLVLEWQRCSGGNWCPLNTVDLDHTAFSKGGVYLIWYNGSPGKVVYVGQGELRERLTAHRRNSRIQRYSKLGLYVTWANVAATHRDGVEVALANRYDPLVGIRHPDVPPTKVNGPWD